MHYFGTGKYCCRYGYWFRIGNPASDKKLSKAGLKMNWLVLAATFPGIFSLNTYLVFKLYRTITNEYFPIIPFAIALTFTLLEIHFAQKTKKLALLGIVSSILCALILSYSATCRVRPEDVEKIKRWRAERIERDFPTKMRPTIPSK